MEEVFFVVDESGAKGYSKNEESYPGELGVVAGYLFNGNILEEVRVELDNILQNFSGDKKIHITDVKAEKQEELRAIVFDLLKRHNTPWIYEAIYVHGLHGTVSRFNEISKKTQQEINSHIKFPDRPEIELLHAKIFAGAVFKAMAFVMDRGLQNFKLNIITDQVDAPVIKKFEHEINTLLMVGIDSKKILKGFNTKTNSIFQQEYSIKVSCEDISNLDLTGINYEITSEDTPLTLVADVLANSIHYHLKKYQELNPLNDLNCDKAIIGHPLRRSLYGIMKNGMPWLSDYIYAHPNRVNKNN